MPDEEKIRQAIDSGSFYGGTGVSFDIDDEKPQQRRRRRSRIWDKAGQKILDKIDGLGLTPEEFAERTKELFTSYDLDSSGTIDLDEFITAITELKLEYGSEQIEQMFDAVDADNNKEIDFNEFEKLLLHLLDDSQEVHTSCPGCGNEIGEKEFLDALASFVTGSYDQQVGNPVRTRLIQTLRNEVTKLNIPTPRDAWELEIVHRIENQVGILIDAEVRRLQTEITAIAEQELREKIKQELEQNYLIQFEQAIRQEIEAELWVQFEEAWNAREVG